jgi:hypothetical protein
VTLLKARSSIIVGQDEGLGLHAGNETPCLETAKQAKLLI